MEETHAPVEVGSLSHYLQGLVHLRWCRISAIKNFGGELFPRQIASECQATGTKNLMYHIWRSLERLCRVTLLFIDVHSWIFTYHTKMYTIYTPSIPCQHLHHQSRTPTSPQGRRFLLAAFGAFGPCWSVVVDPMDCELWDQWPTEGDEQAFKPNRRFSVFFLV